MTTIATRLLSPSIEEDVQGASHRDQNLPLGNIADEFLEEPDSELAIQGSMADSTTQYIVYRQNYYLQGLTLQSSNSLSGNVIKYLHGTPSNDLGAPNGFPNSSPFPNCLVHSALLTWYWPRQGPASLPGTVPMKRYLTEDLAERYVIFSFNQLDIGNWARYNGCICELDL